MKTPSRLHRFDFQPGRKVSFQVDPLNGVVRAVAVITQGEARGHDLEVDATTLSQIKACADGMETVAVKWNHKSGADEVAGFLKNFRVDGKKLLGDLHLLKAHSRFDQIVEMAERMPNNFGLSAAFMGRDEVKHLGRGQKRTFARCEELISVDLVASPACNPSGMFSRKFFADPRPRNAQGEFVGAASGGSNPNDMAAAYNPAVIVKRQVVQQGNSGSVPPAGAGANVIEKFRRRAALAQQADPETTEFARGDSKPSKMRTVAGAAAGAALGGLLGIRSGQMKFRPVRNGEDLAGRVVGVHKSITVAGVPTASVLHVGVMSGGRVLHSSPGSGLKSHTRAAFTEGKPLFVERSGVTTSEESVREAAKRLKGRPWILPSSNCEHTAARLVGRSSSSPQLRGAVTGALSGGAIGGAVGSRKKSGRREFSSVLRRFYFDARTKQSPFGDEIKAGASGAVTGGLLGSVSGLRQGTGALQVAKNIGLGAAAGGLLVGGGSYIGSKILGPVKDGEGAPYTKRAGLGGGVAGAAIGATAGALALKTKLGSAKIAQWAKDWRPAEWAQKSGPVGAAVIGGLAGGILGGSHAADEGQQVDTLNALKKQKNQNSMNTQKSFTRPDTLAAVKYRKKIASDDADRRDAEIFRSGTVGAAAGALFPARFRLPARAGLGAAAGALGVLGVRAATRGTRDRFGERSRAAKTAENVGPVAAGSVAAGLAVKKKITGRFFDRSDEKAIERLAAPFLTRPGGGVVPLPVEQVSRRVLLSRESVDLAMKRGDLRPLRPHERLKGWHYFNAADLDRVRNESVMRIARASYKELSRQSAPLRTFERAMRTRVERGNLHEFVYPWDDREQQQTSPIGSAVKAAGIATAGAGVIGGGVLAGNAIRNRIGTMGATVSGFTAKPAWQQIGSATGSVASDALGSAANGVKGALDGAGNAVGRWGISDSLAGKLAGILKRGAAAI